MPEFFMPTCWRHFFKGNKWWCRACHAETERQFREVCEAYWPVAWMNEPCEFCGTPVNEHSVQQVVSCERDLYTTCSRCGRNPIGFTRSVSRVCSDCARSARGDGP